MYVCTTVELPRDVEALIKILSALAALAAAVEAHFIGTSSRETTRESRFPPPRKIEKKGSIQARAKAAEIFPPM